MKKELYLKTQAAKLTDGQIDRRQFIMSALAAGIVLPSAMTHGHQCHGDDAEKGRHAENRLRLRFDHRLA